MKAFEYYQLAADQGEVIAQYQLAYFYQIGKGVKQNDAKALEYYQLACFLISIFTAFTKKILS
ncbi:Sel1 repeat protein, partial [Snodgrassella alvi SCGC AB-598-O11]